jgi:hypothetical protein
VPGLISIQSIRTNPRRVRGQVVRNESTVEVWVNPEDVLRIVPAEDVEQEARVTVRDGTSLRTGESISSLAARINAALGLSGGSEDVAQAIAIVSDKVSEILEKSALQEGFASQLAIDVAANVPSFDTDALRAGFREDMNAELISSRTASETAFNLALNSGLAGLRVDLGADMDLANRFSGLSNGINSGLSDLRINLGADMDLDNRFSAVGASIGNIGNSVAQLGNDISGLSDDVLGEIGVVQNSIGVANGAISGLGDSIGGLQITIDSIDENVGVTLNNTSQLKSGLTTVSNSVNSLGTNQTNYFNTASGGTSFSYSSINVSNLYPTITGL